MPDAFEHMPPVAIRMPNGALASLAGNVDPHHSVAIADLILARSSVRATVERLVDTCAPDVVGLSIMTFQRETAFQVARLVKMVRPQALVVAGGYDPTLAPEEYESATDFDFIVRGEGEQTFAELLRAIEQSRQQHESRAQTAVHGPDGGPDAHMLSGIKGLSFRQSGTWTHTAARPVMALATEKLRLPNRSARVLHGYTLVGRQVDVVETSRGCTFDCSFCSIIEMRGRNFHPYPIERVLADIGDARRHGAEAIFIVDDNITLDVHRFEQLCRAIVEAGFHDSEYFVQAMTAPLAQYGATLAPLMRRAGFRYVFLGIENVLDEDLGFLRARAKNTRRERGRTVGNASVDAIGHLHRHGMFVVGGLIVGNPDDTLDSIDANLDFARRYIDWPYIQHPTPYPRTPMTADFRARGLIVDDDVSHYDGTSAVVRSQHVSADEIEFRRWRAERWIKLKHFPHACLHSPRFVARHGIRMLSHTFAGSTWRSCLGLEASRRVFDRFRTQRRAEREACLPFGPSEPAGRGSRAA
jgi:anaerobic magnesium-protoporphyrin IX monomethyl ester cyclase